MSATRIVTLAKRSPRDLPTGRVNLDELGYVQGMSARGGFVYSEYRRAGRIHVGDLIRTDAGWSVVAYVARYRVTPLDVSTGLTLIDPDGTLSARILHEYDGAEVRTDTGIDHLSIPHADALREHVNAGGYAPLRPQPVLAAA